MGISHAISPLVPSALRKPAKKIRNLLSYEFGVRLMGRDPFLPPPSLHPVGDGDYKEIGEEFFDYFKALAGLKPDDRVLDIGCGTGRMARPLTEYLDGGTYDGLDISQSAIDWCRKIYTRRYPHFRFHFADIQNSFFNREGKDAPAQYRFPFPDASFDFVLLTSVFTHMLPPAMANYFAEITRVMRPGGRCLATFFLITPDALQLMNDDVSDFKFVELAGCYVADLQRPEYAVAYPEMEIRELYRQAGLQIAAPIHFGSWCGRQDGLSFQDIVIATR